MQSFDTSDDLTFREQLARALGVDPADAPVPSRQVRLTQTETGLHVRIQCRHGNTEETFPLPLPEGLTESDAARHVATRHLLRLRCGCGPALKRDPLLRKQAKPTRRARGR